MSALSDAEPPFSDLQPPIASVFQEIISSSFSICKYICLQFKNVFVSNMNMYLPFLKFAFLANKVVCLEVACFVFGNDLFAVVACKVVNNNGDRQSHDKHTAHSTEGSNNLVVVIMTNSMITMIILLFRMINDISRINIIDNS